MSEQFIAFLEELADVIEKHNGGITYTRSDDGIHVTQGAESVCVGWPDDGDASEIRELIKNSE